MDAFFQWLTNNPIASTAFILLLAVIGISAVLIYLFAFFQGREISFWPPKIGERLQKNNLGEKHRKFEPGRTKKLFNLDGNILLSRSIVYDNDKGFIRDSDSRVAGRITPLIENQISFDDPSFSIDHPSSHLIVLGSIRYNTYAELIQKYFNLPYEYVFSSYGENYKSRILKIITEYGDELAASSDRRFDDSEIEVDYGILFCGNLSNNKKVLWISGIHGYGTVGVYQFLTENAPDVYQALGKDENTGTSWLLRIKYKKAVTDHLKAILDIEVLGHPTACSKKQFSKIPKALVCDLGNVILYFDRARTYRAIAHFLNTSFKDVQERIESTDLPRRYETGSLTDEEFLAELSCVVGDEKQKIGKDLLSEFWSDIFWPNYEMFHALKYLKQKGITLILLSNTNSLHFQNVARDYPDIIGLFDNLVLSYKENKLKPDQNIFSKAISVSLAQCGGILQEILYVDDIEEYVKMAKNLGIEGIVFRSYPHFAFWLRKKGLYVP
jgi:glucose-1-phosphatase